MVLLYVVLSNIQPQPEYILLDEVAKGLDLFESMSGIIVARRCGEITRQILHIARRSVQERRRETNIPHLEQQRQDGSSDDTRRTAHPSPESTYLGLGLELDIGWIGSRDDLFANLADCNFMDGLLNFDNNTMEILRTVV